jgi:CMP-N,N'-diacetyllegionaminic acid synthase
LKIIALIPARSGSKRVKDKNIRLLGGIPLLNYSIRTAHDCGLKAVVSTDSEEYADIALAESADVLMRPECLATDDCDDRKVVTHFLLQHPCDIVVYLRPTTPFRESSMIVRAIKEFQGTGLRSVEEMGESAYKCFEIEMGRLFPVWVHDFDDTVRFDLTDQPNHKCPKTYHPNGYVDLIRAEWVKKGQLWGPEKQAFITPRVIEIDTEEDFEMAEWWLQRSCAQSSVNGV